MDSEEKEATIAKAQKRDEQFQWEGSVVVSETLNSLLKATLNANYKKSLSIFLPFTKIPINLFLPFVCELLTC